MRYVLAPFKYVLGKFWIWAGGVFTLRGGGLINGEGIKQHTYRPYKFKLVAQSRQLMQTISISISASASGSVSISRSVCMYLCVRIHMYYMYTCLAIYLSVCLSIQSIIHILSHSRFVPAMPLARQGLRTKLAVGILTTRLALQAEVDRDLQLLNCLQCRSTWTLKLPKITVC